MRLTRRQYLASAGSVIVPVAVRASTANLERQVHRAINSQREMYGVPPLRWSEALASTSRGHNGRMSSAGFFAHQDPQYGDLAQRLTAAGLGWSNIAENIFRERGYPDVVSIALIEWLYSAGHRHNILNDVFLETGVGIAVSRDEDYFVTQQFLLRSEEGAYPR